MVLTHIIELEKRNSDLEAWLGHEQVVTMQDREAQLQRYILELEKKVEFWAGVAMKYAPDEEVMEGWPLKSLQKLDTMLRVIKTGTCTI